MAAVARILFSIGLPIVAIVTGWWVYRDANQRGRGELAPWIGAVIAGLFLAGSVPGLVALAVAQESAIQGFPTALRVVPGLAALLVYLRFR